jgi:hypothetical protein
VPPTLVFVNARTACEPTRRFLAAACPGLQVAALGTSADEREGPLARFAAGEVRVLVATGKKGWWWWRGRCGCWWPQARRGGGGGGGGAGARGHRQEGVVVVAGEVRVLVATGKKGWWW